MHKNTLQSKWWGTLVFLLLGLQIYAGNQLPLLLRQEAGLREPAQAAHLLLQAEPRALGSWLAENGGRIKYSKGDLHSVVLPWGIVKSLDGLPFVFQIENTSAKGFPLMDTALIRNRIDSVHAGLPPLARTLSGKQVVIGIIDGGIYFNHPDFKRADGSSRIRFIWDQAVANPTNAPVPYLYGQQWSWIDIDAGNCAHVTPPGDFGHGTNVAGIAASNGLAPGNQKGVAPDAEIIAVRVDYNGDFLAHVADAADYIFKKADAMGKACVINTSLGTYYGSRDGKDITTRMIEQLLEERKGRSLVAAAGNAGNIPYHLAYPLTADTVFTWFTYSNGLNGLYFDFWADTANFNRAWFSIGTDDTLGQFLGRLPFFNLPSQFSPAQLASGVTLSRNLFSPGNQLLGTINLYFEEREGTYHCEFQILPVDRSHRWRLETFGSGRFDLWASSSLIGTSDMVTGVPGLAFDPRYRMPDTLKTLVSSWQCSDKVITVGNYHNRGNYLSADSILVSLADSPYDELPGALAATSSRGNTRDGRIKPDLAATGSTIISTGDLTHINGLLNGNALNRSKVYISRYHSRNGGTSMASPMVAGVAALYFEKRPTAGWKEVKEAIRRAAFGDEFTGALPNSGFGFGKLSGFGAVTYNGFVFGCTDPAAFNYNALADLDSGSCIAVLSGCMDTTAINYNALANTADSSCIYLSSSRNQEADWAPVFYPQPARDVLIWKSPVPLNALMQWTDVHGRKVAEMVLEGSSGSLDLRSFASGFYLYRLSSGDASRSGKIIVQP